VSEQWPCQRHDQATGHCRRYEWLGISSHTPGNAREACFGNAPQANDVAIDHPTSSQVDRFPLLVLRGQDDKIVAHV
jgi:hypothetical protein